MDAMSSAISANLKKIRKEKKLSLDNVAELSGVSKSMLGQIERGESSPTVATLWKIATGLHISFTALLEEEKKITKIIGKEEIRPLLSDEGHFRLFPFFPYEEERRFEILYIEIDPGGRSESMPHESGTEEYMLVVEGRIRLQMEEMEYVVQEGHGLRYRADKAHVYENIGDGLAKLYMVIYY